MTQQVQESHEQSPVVQASGPPPRPRILYLCPRMPWPLDSGGNIRILNLVKYASRVTTVDMLCFAADGPPAEHLNALRQYCRQVHFVRVGRRTPMRILFAAAAGLVKGVPLLAMLDYHRGVADALSAMIRQGQYDFIYYDYLHTGQYLLANTGSPRALCGLHNVESEIWRRKARHSRNLVARAFLNWQARVLERYERRVIASADLCTTVCHRDTQQVASWGDAKTTVKTLDIGIDFETLPQPPVSAEPDGLVFVGSMDWQPNQDAVLGMLTQEFIAFLQKSSLRLRVVGRAIPPSMRAMQSDVVEFLDNVPDLGPIYGRSLAMVVPLRIAGGTRVKIREAMAHGVAVISTSVGAEGTMCTDGKDILIAEDLVGVIRAVERLQDGRFRQSVVSQAMQLVQLRYDAKVIAEEFVEYLRQFMPQQVVP